MNITLNCSEKEQWEAAMQEMDSIYSNNVWDLVELLENRKLIGSKWVFKKKNKGRWINWAMQSSVSCSRFFTEARPRLRRNFQSSH